MLYRFKNRNLPYSVPGDNVHNSSVPHKKYTSNSNERVCGFIIDLIALISIFVKVVNTFITRAIYFVNYLFIY